MLRERTGIRIGHLLDVFDKMDSYASGLPGFRSERAVAHFQWCGREIVTLLEGKCCSLKADAYEYTEGEGFDDEDEDERHEDKEHGDGENDERVSSLMENEGVGKYGEDDGVEEGGVDHLTFEELRALTGNVSQRMDQGKLMAWLENSGHESTVTQQATVGNEIRGKRDTRLQMIPFLVPSCISWL